MSKCRYGIISCLWHYYCKIVLSVYGLQNTQWHCKYYQDGYNKGKYKTFLNLRDI